MHNKAKNQSIRLDFRIIVRIARHVEGHTSITLRARYCVDVSDGPNTNAFICRHLQNILACHDFEWIGRYDKVALIVSQNTVTHIMYRGR